MTHVFHTGDSITITWENVTYQYIIRELMDDLVYISPVSNMDIRNIIVYVNDRWRVKGRENVDYKIEFPTIGTSPIHINPITFSNLSAETQVKVDYGKFSDKLPEINAMYNNIAERFQILANEAGMGAGTHRHFDGEAFIQYAIDNNLWENSVDHIYAHLVMKKLEEADLVLQELQPQQGIYPLSKSGKQCISACKRDSRGNCYCNTEKYSGWTGKFDWDYCNEQDCTGFFSQNLPPRQETPILNPPITGKEGKAEKDSPVTFTPGIVPVTFTPGIVPVTVTPGIAPVTVTPGIAPVTFTPGIASVNNRLELFKTPHGRFQYESLLQSTFDKIVAPNGYQCIHTKVDGHSLLDHFNLTMKIGQGSFGTVYSACAPLEQLGTCIDDPYVFAVKVAIASKQSVKVLSKNRFKTVVWAESYLMEQLRPLILDNGKGQAFPIMYKNYACVDGCRPSDPAKTKSESCIINLMELAEGDLNTWTNTIATGHEDYDNALFQVMAGVAALQDSNIQVFHNDIKKENILWYKVQPGGVWMYNIGNKSYYLPNRGYVMIISDYGVSESYGSQFNFGTPKGSSPRGWRGIIRDEEKGISYPLLFNDKDFSTGRTAKISRGSMSGFVVDGNEIPTDISVNLGKITRDKTLMYREVTRKLLIAPISYIGNFSRPVLCPTYDTFTMKEREIIGNKNICSMEILERTDVYPNIQYIIDTQDGIRLFAGGSRMNQPGTHKPIDGAPPDWIQNLKNSISGDPTENSKSLYNRKMFAQDFISHYFNGKYSTPGNDPVLAKFTCAL